jgi:hypothetical protein
VLEVDGLTNPPREPINRVKYAQRLMVRTSLYLSSSARATPDAECLFRSTPLFAERPAGDL